MGNCIKPQCFNSETTSIKIKSSCFDKPIEIHFGNDDEETHAVLEEIVSKILERKKTIIEKKRLSQVKEPDNPVLIDNV